MVNELELPADAATNASSSATGESAGTPARTESKTMQWLRDAFRNMDRVPSSHMRRAVQQLPEQEISQALALLEGEPLDRTTHEMINDMMSQWGKQDLHAALEHADSYENRIVRKSAREHALRSWASDHPYEAWRLAADGDPKDPLVRGLNMESVFAGMAREDAEGALQRVWDLEDPRMRHAALRGAMHGFPAEERTARYRDLYHQVTEVEDMKQISRSVIYDMRHYQPHEAARWVNSIQEPEVRKDSVSHLTYSWGNSDPPEAIRWLGTVEPELRDSNMERVVRYWANDNPNEVRNYLQRNPPSPQMDAAYLGYAKTLQKENPAAALNWADGVVDAEKRHAYIRSAGRQLIDQDPAAAADYMATANLDERTREYLNKALIKKLQTAQSTP